LAKYDTRPLENKLQFRHQLMMFAHDEEPQRINYKPCHSSSTPCIINHQQDSRPDDAPQLKDLAGVAFE